LNVEFWVGYGYLNLILKGFLMIDWIIENKEWLFSGLAIAVPVAIISWIFAKRRSSKVQSQDGGNNSTFIQAGRDITLGNLNKREGDNATE